MFCVDAGPDFDWCRVCGRGMVCTDEATPQPSALSEAVRKAQGKHLTGDEIERAILATHPPGCSCGKHGG